MQKKVEFWRCSGRWDGAIVDRALEIKP